ncbi:hypothetical protein [Flavobacterium litorale]|uniref:Apea-like HEPN domain-containing protein n=1 Tax=Flavobacterium litorale TaxID=2856519 RepID=A0ABX8V9Y6_9FLAO|nr:hypothetical protein [Flavobacterium litorale]QYJ67836.1 hypothetical protein K1I41_09820 [Flavobacterium litorale]
MKYFTHPKGIFEIQIPLDWYYKNEIAGYENKSPFSFELFEETQGCFQISCYNSNEKKINPDLPKHNYNSSELKFIKNILPDPEFSIFLWTVVVEDYIFMAKYICQPNDINKHIIKKELIKVKKSLSTLVCLSPDRRDHAIGFDRYEKFNASLAASFDLKNKAIENLSFIELIILNSNHIDAYLRLCIVLRLQIINKTDLFEIKYLYQQVNDKPIMEKKIYDEAKKMNIILEYQHKKLYQLYNLRNKVVHRYVITDIKTFELLEIAYKYEQLCEDIRIILSKIETEQYENKIGYHALKNPHREKKQDFVDQLFSMVNDKHFYTKFNRDI